jgi:hypothetical protein
MSTTSTPTRFRFTPERLRKLLPLAAVYHDVQQDGLVARRQTFGGELVYYVRYRLPGAAGSSRMTLGRVSALPLAKARQMAQGALVLARQGIDPAEARRASVKAAEAAKASELTLDAFLAEYLDVQRSERVRSAPERVVAIRRHVPALLKESVRGLSRRDLVAGIDAVKKKYPSAAAKLRASLHHVFEVAVDRGVVGANPLAGHRARRGSLKAKNVAEAEREEQALSLDSLARIWSAAGDSNVNPNFCRYVRIMIGTGARRAELSKAEIAGLRPAGDGLPAQLLLAAPTTKTGRPHTLFLPPLLLGEVDRTRRRHDERLAFPGRGGREMTGWSKLMPPLVEAARRLGVTGHVHLHAFRKALRTGLSVLGVERVIGELMLNHAQDKLTRTYDKHHFERERADAAIRWCEALEAAIAKVEAEPSAANAQEGLLHPAGPVRSARDADGGREVLKQMDDDRLPTWLTPEGRRKLRRRLDEERRARAQAPLAIRLRHMLDAAAAQPAIDFPHDDWPDIAGSFLQLESMVEDEEARRSDKLHCYATAIRGLAAEVSEFGDLAEALEVHNSGNTSPLLRPRRLPRENKPPEYSELARYAAIAFSNAAYDLHERGEKLVVDRVMAEVFGEARTGTENYTNNLLNPWLPLRGRTWDQARFLVEKGFSLMGREKNQILKYVEAGFKPGTLLKETACRRSILKEKDAADAAWRAAGVKPSRR